MLVLFETPAGYALFKVKNDGKLDDPNNLWKEFETPEKANKIVKLQSFSKFSNTAEALGAATALVEGNLSKELKGFLKDEVVEKKLKDELAVADAKLGGIIKEKLGITCVHDTKVQELFRGIRSQMSNLITGLPENEMKAMILGLSHSLSRYKLKFSPDKVDTMIIQAISLLDDLDKELNTYAMRVKEWYGWHFPELGKVIVDNIAFAKTVKAIGFRSNTSKTDLSTILPEELEQEVKELAEISMGTEISDEDIFNITHLCDQVLSLSEYRTQLFEYLKNRMNAIAPNLTCMVGELVGARLISHAGSLMNLAKHPASTVQILGAEKALFRALKTKHDTPKYGLIYHASLVGQAAPKYKGKISRVLAAKTALSIRMDALGEKVSADVGMENRLKVENRLRQLEGKQKIQSTAGMKAKHQTKKFEAPADTSSYSSSADTTLTSASKKEKLEKREAKEEKKEKKEKEKKEKKEKKKSEEEDEDEEEEEEKKEKKEKKKDKKEKEEKKEKKEKEEKKEKKDKKEKKEEKEEKEEKKEKKEKKKEKEEKEEKKEKKEKKSKDEEESKAGKKRKAESDEGESKKKKKKSD